MKTTAKRFGNGAGDATSAKESDSSHGNAIVTPAPRRTVRREIPRANFLFFGCGILITSLGYRSVLLGRPAASSMQELRAGYDCLNQRAELVVIFL
jgi:hypothetical protein